MGLNPFATSRHAAGRHSKHHRRHKPRALLHKVLPLLTTPIFYGLCYLASWLQFDVRITAKAVPFDLLLQLVLGYALFALSKRLWVFVVLQGLVMAVLYVGNAVKISFFGGPIAPDDLYALKSLLLILEGWRFILAALPLAMIAALLVFNLTLRRWSAYLSLTLGILLGVTLLYEPASILQPLDRTFGNSVWDQRSNYLNRGATLYSLQESARYFADAAVPPDRDAALGAAAALLADAPPRAEAAAPFVPRNVHLIILESFWDPALLAKAGYNRDPLTPEFRALWRAAGDSHAVSPVFGGYTANAEFEVMCGFPVVKDNVKFERQLLNDVPCLPRLLGERGYRTIASHPNVPVFWNRVNAYRRLGFQSYWARDEFKLDDMNGEFLSDASLYRQVLEKISGDLKSGQPVFDYILTYFGHWRYPLNDARPALITSPSRVTEVSTYANTAYYKARELTAFLDELRRVDPQSIIVVFGDHLPFLGENFKGYVDSGVLTSKRSDFTPEMRRFQLSTPLLIIDGPRGPVKAGELPIYEIPALVLRLLGIESPTIMDYTRPPPGMQVRPRPGLHIDLLEDGSVTVCREPPYTGACAVSSRWLERVLTVNDDLFIGRQFTREGYQPRTAGGPP